MLGTITIPAAPTGTPSGGGAVNVRFWSNPLLLPLADFLNADGNGLVTLVLINATGTSSKNCEDTFASEEAGISKALALVPEPATMIILGLGSLILARSKRR